MAKEKIPEELGLALVLTIYEAKGLEFDDVLLYNFFTDSEVCHTNALHTALPIWERTWSQVAVGSSRCLFLFGVLSSCMRLCVSGCGCDTGCGLSHSMSWAGSPHAHHSRSLAFTFFWMPGTQLPASGFHWLLLSLTPEDAGVGVHSKESLTNEAGLAEGPPYEDRAGHTQSMEGVSFDTLESAPELTL